LVKSIEVHTWVPDEKDGCGRRFFWSVGHRHVFVCVCGVGGGVRIGETGRLDTPIVYDAETPIIDGHMESSWSCIYSTNTTLLLYV